MTDTTTYATLAAAAAAGWAGAGRILVRLTPKITTVIVQSARRELLMQQTNELLREVIARLERVEHAQLGARKRRPATSTQGE